MSLMRDIRTEIVSKLVAAAAADGKTVTIRGSAVLVVELEKELTTPVIEVIPLTVARARDTRKKWSRNYTMRVALRQQSSGRNASQIVAQEDAFIDLADWLGDKLEAMDLDGEYGIDTIADADPVARDPYLEVGQLICLLDVGVLTHL